MFKNTRQTSNKALSNTSIQYLVLYKVILKAITNNLVKKFPDSRGIIIIVSIIAEPQKFVYITISVTGYTYVILLQICFQRLSKEVVLTT